MSVQEGDPERKERGTPISHLEDSSATLGCCSSIVGDGIRLSRHLINLRWGLVRLVISSVGCDRMGVRKEAHSDCLISMPELYGVSHLVLRMIYFFTTLRNRPE